MVHHLGSSPMARRTSCRVRSCSSRNGFGPCHRWNRYISRHIPTEEICRHRQRLSERSVATLWSRSRRSRLAGRHHCCLIRLISCSSLLISQYISPRRIPNIFTIVTYREKTRVSFPPPADVSVRRISWTRDLHRMPAAVNRSHCVIFFARKKHFKYFLRRWGWQSGSLYHPSEHVLQKRSLEGEIRTSCCLYEILIIFYSTENNHQRHLDSSRVCQTLGMTWLRVPCWRRNFLKCTWYRT